MPDSFAKYLMHSFMEDVQRRLAEEEGIITKSVRGVECPFHGPEDVENGLNNAIKSYEAVLHDLAKSATAYEGI